MQKKHVQGYLLYSAWLIAVIGFVISVFYGEILGNAPCPLCWYQRSFLFPLVVLLGIASYRGDVSIVPYAQVLVVLGAVVGFLQVAQHYFPVLRVVHVCSFGTHCSGTWLKIFGVIDFPILSIFGFTLMFLCLLRCSSQKR